MSNARLLLITGLPATGKSTLAVKLGALVGWPVITKDLIKEALFDALGTGDHSYSGRLSDASFAVMFALLGELLRTGAGVILEGNFRAREHEPAFQSVLASCQVAQVLCRVPEAERLARLYARQHDPTRHPGHLDATVARAPANLNAGEFMELPGARFLYENLSHQAAVLEWCTRINV